MSQSSEMISSLQWLKDLSKIDVSSASADHNAYQTTTNFLSNVFKDYSKKKVVFSPAERKEAADLLVKSLPAIEKGLKVFYVGFNADLRVGAQTYLSSLQFMFDDLKEDNQEIKEKVEAFSKCDLLEDLKEEVETMKESQTWGDVPVPDLENVPKTHLWWDWD